MDIKIVINSKYLRLKSKCAKISGVWFDCVCLENISKFCARLVICVIKNR